MCLLLWQTVKNVREELCAVQWDEYDDIDRWPGSRYLRGLAKVVDGFLNVLGIFEFIW